MLVDDAYETYSRLVSFLVVDGVRENEIDHIEVAKQLNRIKIDQFYSLELQKLGTVSFDEPEDVADKTVKPPDVIETEAT